MPEIILHGLRPEPLAQYLSAMAVLRLVAEQADDGACGHWQHEAFVLGSALDQDELIEFFCQRYRPSPIVGPWNGGSGFYPKDNTEGLRAITDTDDERLAPYREVIREVQTVLADLGLTAKPEKTAKADLIARLRAELSDDALAWIDAALVLTNDGERYPPLLGTGGNDGRLEFSNNFMKRVADLLLGKPNLQLLRSYLYAEPATGMVAAPVGQFLPSQAGGANSSPGFGANAQVNPWAYVLMLEGALVPSATATRRLESSRGGTMAFPFAVRSATVGYASASPEENRDELWLPLWSAPATFREVRHLFAEGRAKVPSRRAGQVDRREAVDGLDFARAIASLGVNRGVASFSRYGFQQRNGLAYFAVPLGRWEVRQSKGADLLAEIDPWLARLRGYVGSGKAPSSVASATRRLENAIMEACRRDEPETILEVLIALSEVEGTIGRAKERPLNPLPWLSEAWFEATSGDPSPEFRLAASLASAGIRPRLRPVVRAGQRRWAWAASGSKVATWMETASLEQNLLALLRRREIDDQQGKLRIPHRDAHDIGIGETGRRGRPRCWARVADVVAFIDRDGLDEQRLEALIGGLSLIAWPEVAHQPAPELDRAPPASFALLALAHGLEDPEHPNRLLPTTPGMLANARRGTDRCRNPARHSAAVRCRHGLPRRQARRGADASTADGGGIGFSARSKIASAASTVVLSALHPHHQRTRGSAPVTTFELPNAARLLIRARLAPLQGMRFQPTGFPDLGAARYRLHDGTEMLLVESAQSVANRMEAACWDEEAQDVVEPLRGLPYVQVFDGGKPLTNSLLEAHRLNSVYIQKSDLRPILQQAIGYDENKPFDRPSLIKAVCKYDPNALLHGVFLTNVAGVLRIPRALSGFIEARNVHEVASGGVKNDNVRASKGKADEAETRTAAEGYGNVPYHRVEFTAEEIDAFFNLDIAQLRSYRLPEATTQLLYALAVYKIQAFLDRGLRLRTACDFQVLEVDVTRPAGVRLPSETDAAAALRKLIPAAAKEGVFANPPVSRANYSAKAGKSDNADTPEAAAKPSKKASKKSSR
ncbi:MAG: type I-U CRISPR-associated protein Csx17 [Deltaproteobacteria bacterium]|nr:type I-U CRISPR-associated protein Csx17 [Deltaproteobacteria bacterium]